MKKTETIKSPRKHRIMNRPILALFLMPVWCMVLSSFLGKIVDAIGKAYYGAYAGGVGNAVIALLCLFIHKRWFKGEYEGSLRFNNCGKGLLLLLPSFVFIIMNLLEVDFSAVTAESMLLAFFCGLGPGVLEEVAFRGLAGSNFMRVWHAENKIVPAIILTAILFGGVHLMNICAGAGVAISITQAVYSFGIGVLFAAVYFRTGSLLPGIIGHTLVDFTAFMNLELAEAGGVLADNGFDLSMLLMGGLGLGFGALGLYYARSAKRSEILELWTKKWNLSSKQPLQAPQEAETV